MVFKDYVMLWIQIKSLEEKLDGNNKNTAHCFEQIMEAAPYRTVFVWPPPSYLPNHSIKTSKTYCRRSKNKLISDVFLWTPTQGHISVGWQAKTYIDKLFVITVCWQEELPKVMINRAAWHERIKGIYFAGIPLWLWQVVFFNTLYCVFQWTQLF